MQLLSMVYWLLRRRVRQSWGLLAITSFGILAAVTLMSTGALYSRVLGEAGISHSLAIQQPVVLNVLVVTQNRPLGPADYEPLRRLVEDTSQSRMGELLRGLERSGRTQSLPVTTNPQPGTPPLGSPGGRPFFKTGFQEHSHLVAGNWPQAPGRLTNQGVEIETVIGARTARETGFGLGTTVYIVPFRNSPAERIALTVVGHVEPNDPEEEYWMGAPVQFRTATVGEQSVFPFYLTEEDFFQVLGTGFSTLVGNFGFDLFLDTTRIDAGEADGVQANLLGIETDVNKVYPRTLVLSRLGLTIDEFRRDLTLAQVPLYLFISLVVVVLLYSLALVTGILGRSQSEEAGLLRSRGSSLMQVGGVFALAEGVVALVAVAVGPLLAWLLVRFLLLQTIDPAGDGAVPASLGLDMWWMGALGGVLAVGVLVATAAGRARMGVVEALSSQARPPSVPFLHRYYLDLLAVAVVGLIWWQVQGREGFVSRELAGRGFDVDPTLVLGPVLGLFAAAVLLLRVLPLAVRFLAWAGTRGGPAGLTFSLTRLARDPIPHGSLAVILMLAAALGVFGATFQSSLSRSQRQQALYRTGGDLVVRGSGLPRGAVEAAQSLPGVLAVSPVLRESATLLGGELGESAVLVAGDPPQLAQAAWFRDDFSVIGLGELAARLQPEDGPDGSGVALPVDTERVGVWLELSSLVGRDLKGNVNLWARLRNANGFYRTMSIGNIDVTPVPDGAEDNWRFFQGDLPDAPSPEALPWELVSIYFSSSAFTLMEPGHFYLDDITAFGPSNGAQGLLVEGFEGPLGQPGDWTAMATQGGVPDVAVRDTSGARTGNLGLTFTWEEAFGASQRGVALHPGPYPVLAIGGPSYHEGQVVRIKQGRLSVPIRIVGVTQHFPTVNTSTRQLLLVDLDAYHDHLRSLPHAEVNSPDELWLALDPAYDRQAVADQLSEELSGFFFLRDREKVADLAERNPLAGGGWNGLTALSMVAIGIAVVLTLAVYTVVSVRASRMDLAVAGALGFSRGQVILSLGVERVVISVLAIAAGAAIGYWPGLEIVGLLDFTPSGRPAPPPLVPAVQVWLMAAVLAGLGVAAMLSMLFAAVRVRQLNTAEVLRSGG